MVTGKVLQHRHGVVTDGIARGRSGILVQAGDIAEHGVDMTIHETKVGAPHRGGEQLVDVDGDIE